MCYEGSLVAASCNSLCLMKNGLYSPTAKKISSECFVASIVGGGSSHISSRVDALPPWMCLSIGNYCIDDISFLDLFSLLGFGG
jgi:hypothetical protein